MSSDQRGDSSLSILVLGCGSIGMRHARNLKSLGMKRIAVCDPDPERLSDVASKCEAVAYRDFDGALDRFSPEAVIVCTPPYLHLPQALAAIRSGAHVFVEKPLSHSLEGVDELVREIGARACMVQVGYNWRFYPGLQKIKTLIDDGAIGRVLWARAEQGQYLPDWRPDQDYREGYTAHRPLGGGIILDSSHEIDYMRWLFGEVGQVYCVAGVLGDLEVDAEDTASMILRFESGCVGEVHLDFVQRARSRGCKIVGTEGTIIWDYLDASVQLFTANAGEWERFDIPADPNDKYLAEMESFLSCIDGSRRPVVDVCSARRTLEVALAARQSACVNLPVNLPLAHGVIS